MNGAKHLKRYLVCLLLLCGTAHAQSIDVQHYKFEIDLSDQSNAIMGKASIRIKFLEPAVQIKFDLASGADENGMYVFQVKEDSHLLKTFHSNDVLTITLDKPAAANEIRTFEISYMGTPKDGLIISKNKHGERTFFADNWPNRAHNWIPCNDTPADKATVEFIVKAPQHYRVVSNGLLQEEKKFAGDQKLTHWKEVLPIPTKVMVIGAADFAVKRVDSGYHIPVTAWVYRQDSTNGFYDYALGDDILKYFESYIGSYPYKKLANVQSTTIFGGMENAGAIFYDENTVTGTRSSEALMAHEIAHQWFGNTATEKGFAHLWLSEGFATYLTDMYIEQKYGVDSFRKRLQQEREAVIGFSKRSETPVVDSVSAFMDLLNANSYQKGAWVLHMLRHEVGDSIFQKIIRSYYNGYKFVNADSKDFQRIAESVSGKDLNWFFDQWLYRPGIPKLDIDMKVDGESFELNIRQTGKPYRLTLELDIISATNQRTRRRIDVDGALTEMKIKTTGPFRVELDPDKQLLYAEVD
jgi:aminopeptidase N